MTDVRRFPDDIDHGIMMMIEAAMEHAGCNRQQIGEALNFAAVELEIYACDEAEQREIG